MTRSILRAVAIPFTALAVAAVLVSCSDDDPGTSSADPGQPSASGTATPTGQSADQLAQQLLATATPEPAIATASASVRLNPGLTGGTPVPLTAEVVGVSAAGSTTVLHWRLRSQGDASVRPIGNWLSGGTSSPDTSQLAVVDTAGKRRMLPYKTDTGDFATSCICSSLPRDVDGTGVDLYATYPALDESATTIDVAIPQFPVMKGVAVTR